MFRQPKISAIIPVYNTEKYLRECLDSVVNQTLGDIEIICVDDGSTDNSLHILREYEEEDSRILVITQNNATAGAARNNGIEHAHGKYLLFIDSDDYLELDAFKRVYALANQHHADVTIFGGKVFNELTGTVNSAPHYVHYRVMPSVQPFSALDSAGNIFQIAHPGPFNKLFRASYIHEHSLRFQALPNTNDLFFVCSAISEADRICYCKDPLYYHRTGTGISTQDHKAKNPKCFFYALNALKSRLMESGRYDTFYDSYVKFAVSTCEWNFKSFSYDVLSEEERQEIMDAAVLPEPVSRPLVSVIIPVYNAENDLKACLDSVVSQTLEEIEIICVNDGSTDGSATILSQYEKQDSRIRILCNDTNRGRLYTRKVGVMAAEGKYITFVDPDDSLLPDACERMLDAARSNTLDIAQFGVEVVNCSDVQGATDYRAKAMQPKDMALAGENLVRSFFVDRVNVTSVVAKLYKRELCQTAYSKIADGYCNVGEDIFSFFFLCLYGVRYKGFPEIKAYRYNFGRGDSNEGAVSLEKFEEYCKRSACVRYTQEFLERHAPDEANQAGVNAMGVRMLTDCCQMFASGVAEKDRASAAKILKSSWEEFSFTEKVIEDTFHMSSAQLWNTYFDIPCYYKEAPAYLAGNQPRVSVIIPAYNVEKYLRECIDSIINQSLKEIEIICVNDGSHDSSLAIIEEYAEKDDRIAVISQRNGGLSCARNRGLEAAHGKYIYFFDGDDILVQSALKELYETAEKDRLDILLFGADVFFESEELMKANAGYIGYYDRENIPDVLSGCELLSIYSETEGFRSSIPLQLFNAQFLRNTKVRFVEGIVHEDELFSSTILPKAHRLRVSTAKYYLRRVRGNSIVTSSVNHKHVEGTFLVAVNILDEAESYKHEKGAYIFLSNYGKRMLVSTKNKFRQLSKEERAKVFADDRKNKSLFFLYCREAIGLIFENPASRALTAPDVDEAALIRASVSYRAGRFITFIPRKIRGGIRCYKQHGLRYSVHRLLVHLHMRKE